MYLACCERLHVVSNSDVKQPLYAANTYNTLALDRNR
jgi:hypothetical protein